MALFVVFLMLMAEVLMLCARLVFPYANVVRHVHGESENNAV